MGGIVGEFVLVGIYGLLEDGDVVFGFGVGVEGYGEISKFLFGVDFDGDGGDDIESVFVVVMESLE